MGLSYHFECEKCNRTSSISRPTDAPPPEPICDKCRNKNMTPQECLKGCFASTFGMCEYEELAKSIVNFLANDQSVTAGLGWDRGEAWKRQFLISEVCDSPELFAMFAAAGWVHNTYFPKGGFVVSDGFIERVTATVCLSCKGNRFEFDRCTAGNRK